MAATIRQLDQATALKIAAGEVVERPASAVKELLENALDARPDRVVVSLRGGGLESIRVADDGRGIAADDLGLLFRRHATSKIGGIEDLERLATYGFRGEALAAIAAVAEVAVVTRTADAAHGESLTFEDGRVVAHSAAGCPVGTTVTIRRLFANVPARLKFVRSAPSETGLIAHHVGLYALAHPRVHVAFQADARTPIVYPGDGDERAAARLLLGDDVAAALIPVGPDELGGVRVRGWLTEPGVHRPVRTGLHFYVNGRPIVSRTLQHAVDDAYRLHLPAGRHPAGAIFVAVDPAEVDVNVHPRKWEVRFVRDREVFAAVQRATRRALAEVAPPPAISVGLESVGTPAGDPLARPFPAGRPSGDQTDAPGGDGQRPLPWPDPVASDPAPKIGTGEPSTTAGGSRLPILRIVGQVQNTYVVCEGPDGLYFVDQHTAHERVLYEEIAAQRLAAGVARQTLLEPAVVELAPRQAASLAAVADDARSLGFASEPFGEASALLREVPARLERGDTGAVFRELIDALVERAPAPDGSDRAIATVACHAAVRAGDPLTMPEIRELIERLERTDMSRICPHGRPTVIRLPLAQLERDFQRR